MRRDLMFVFESSKGKDLFTVESLLGLCRAEQQFILPYVNSKCPMMSVPMYVTLLSDKESCLDLVEADVASVRKLLEKCAIFYRNGTPSTTEKHAAGIGIPRECARGGYIATMLHHFADVKFFAKSHPKSSRLRYALAYLRTDSVVFDEQAFYMDHLNEKGLDNGVVKITAVGLTDQSTTKFDLFGKYLIIDLKYFALAAVIILVLMILYLKSFSLVIATLTNVGFSFVFAYFVYSAVFRLEFFPFINVLALLILIAVGADDVFVFYDSWQQAKISEDGRPLEMVTARTFSHAALSIFVTSLTTAAAFFTNYVSHITAVCCFGVFAGTAILSNFLFMVTWTPAVIIVVDRIETWVCSQLPATWGSTATSLLNRYLFLRNICGRIHHFLFETMFPFLIGKLWFLWIVLLLGLGIGGCVVVFVTPRLRLPVTKDIQLFPASNLLENWDLNMQDKFQGVMSQMNKEAQSLPAMFVWGFQPRDDGSKLNPDDDPSHLVRQKHFNLYAPESQTWLLELCHDLQNQTWVPSGYRRNMMCTLDAYSEVLKRTCPMDLPLLDPYKDACCHNVTIPLGEEQLKLCGPAADLILFAVNDPASMLYSYADLEPLKRILQFGMPIYDKDNNNILGFGLRVTTTFKYSYSLEIMDKQYHAMLDFFHKHMHKAPRGMKGGFFSDEYTLSFYDLQNAIAEGTYYSIMLSLIVALLVMLITSRNLLLTLYAIITITLAIAGNVASIVLLGWRLNIIESVTISLAVGLSIDFTIHYGMAYRLSSAKDAKSRVNESFSRVGGAVAMAALTTFSAGAAVIPCHVLPYTKLGMFLMLCMSFSWVYATFFFQSVCRIIGPKANFCQMPSVCDKIKKCKKKHTDDGDAHSLNSLESNDSFLITF